MHDSDILDILDNFWSGNKDASLSFSVRKAIYCLRNLILHFIPLLFSLGVVGIVPEGVVLTLQNPPPQLLV